MGNLTILFDVFSRAFQKKVLIKCKKKNYVDRFGQAGGSIFFLQGHNFNSLKIKADELDCKLVWPKLKFV